MEAVRSILKERKEREQSQLIFEAKQKVKDWEELDSNSEVIEIIGEELEGSRKEMAILSMAILRRDYPNESIAQLGIRFRSLKKLCTGP